VAHPSNVYRRPSGNYVVRLVVPPRHRKAVGKGEIHLSTGSRAADVAKATACRLLAHWREVFLSLDRHGSMDRKRAASDFTLIVVQLISPDVETGEATFTTALGKRLMREPSETEDDLIDRIHDYAEANFPFGQSAVVHGDPETRGPLDRAQSRQPPRDLA